MDNVIPYELSLKLHSKNFTSPTKYYYNIYNKHIFPININLHSESILAPTYDDVVKWFKDIHNMIVDPTIESIENAIKKI